MRSDLDLDYFKVKLEEELQLVQSELSKIGKINPDMPGNGATDWQPKVDNMDIDEADESEVADKFEELEGNTALVNELETRYNNLKEALKRIEGGSYGICKVGGEPIEKERLEANPSAETCKQHME